MWGAILNKWDFVEKISEYPDYDCSYDIDDKVQDRDFVVALAGFLRKIPEDQLFKMLD